jgi:hypothetical protein
VKAGKYQLEHCQSPHEVEDLEYVDVMLLVGDDSHSKDDIAGCGDVNADGGLPFGPDLLLY